MTITRNRIDAAAYALSLAGRSRDHLPVPWTDSAAIDDCARFASHVIWGGWPISWVDNFKTAGDGAYAQGAGDLQPWDVLLFDWEGNGVGNHVEFYLEDAGNGYVRTYGANGSDTRAAAYRLRPRRYIMGRFRPAWAASPVAAPAPVLIKPTRTPVGDIVTSRIITTANGRTYLANPDTMQKLWMKSPAQASFWRNVGVPSVDGRQPNSVLAGFKG